MTGIGSLARSKAWLVDRFELSRGTVGHNVRPMEGLRGFAVFLVFLVHYCTLVGPWIVGHPDLSRFAGAMHAVGNSGVDLFFVLSGYLIYGSLIARPQPFGRFMKRRVQRIYPAFLAVFALYVALSYAMPAERKIPSDWLAASLYLGENLLLLPGLFPIEPLITVAWSLSYEMFYYLAIPLIIVAFALRARSTAWRVAFFALVATAIFAWCALFPGHVRLTMFIAGILLHETMRARKVEAPGSVVAATALVAALAATLLPLDGPAGFALRIAALFAGFFVVCFACFSRPGIALARAFSVTPLRWLGNMSYSYYLLHGLALKAAFVVFAVVVGPAALAGSGASIALFWMLLPAMFASTLVPTALLFLFVEHPWSLAPKKPLDAGNALPTT